MKKQDHTIMSQDPVIDNDRILEIARLRLHEDAVDDILNEYAKQAAEEFDLPIGLVSIVLDDVQKFAAAHGLGGWIGDTGSTPVEWAFCANSVRTNSPFIVENAPDHALVRDNPLVTQDGIKCYAGAPIISKNGYVLGNFCVIGSEERSFSEEEVNRLKEYAKIAAKRLETRVS